MKKLVLFLFTTLVLSSCDYNENRIGDKVSKEKIPFKCATEFEYKDHSFIKFTDKDGEYAIAGVVHNPNCKCYKDSLCQ